MTPIVTIKLLTNFEGNMRNKLNRIKGVILAGGKGSRLYPITDVINKQLLPIYDKPLIYYAISLHLLAGIVEIGIVADEYNLERYKKLLGDGSEFGVKFSYILQSEPLGLAHGLLLARDYIGSSDVFFTLGDNILYGTHLTRTLQRIISSERSTIFGYRVQDPSNYGVIELDKTGKPKRLVEKPSDPQSNLISIGLYFFKNEQLKKLSHINKSDRGEFEITDFNQLLLNDRVLDVSVLERGLAWFDCGSHKSMHRACRLVEAIQESHGFKIACLEEIAYARNFIDKTQLSNTRAFNSSGDYADYVRALIS